MNLRIFRNPKKLKLIKYIIKRLLATIPIIIGLLIFIFFIIHQSDTLRIQLWWVYDLNVEGYLALIDKLDLNKPIFIQFLRYLEDLFTGDFGLSYIYDLNEPVLYLIARRLPITIDILLLSLFISSFLGIIFGIKIAQHKNELREKIIHSISLIGKSFPIFILGLLLKMIFSSEGLFGIFPGEFQFFEEDSPPLISGFLLIDSLLVGNFNYTFDYLSFITLPIICLSLINMANISYQTRNSMVNVLNQDYIRTARAKGYKEKGVIKKHAFKNALIPLVKNMKFNIAALLSGVILVENVFAIDGLGNLLVRAIKLMDIWLIQGVCFIFILLFVATKFISDIVYTFLNPSIL